MAQNLTDGKTKKEIYDEQKALRQLEKEKELKKQQKKEAKKNKGYVNMANQLWTKIIVGVLIFAMIAGIVFSFIYAIINLF